MASTPTTYQKISELTAKITVADGDTLFILDSSNGTSKKITKANLVTGLTTSDISDITSTATELNVLDGIPATLTATELGYADGVTSAIQTQIDTKAPLASPTFTGTVTIPTPFTIGAVSMTSTATELNLLDGKSLLGSDTGIATGTAGTASDLAIWNGDGDLVDGPTPPSGTIVGTSDTQTLTNKRVDPRVVTTADDATAVINVDVTDVYELSAVANATEFTLTGTPTDGQKLIVRIKDAGVTKGLTWTGFTEIGVTLPTDTTAGKWHVVGSIYNAGVSQWQAVAAPEES